MKFHFITVPIPGSDAAEEELNRFLASHRVLAVDRQLVADGPRSAWAICVSYTEASGPAVTEGLGKKGRLDYREILTPEDFQVFARLRDLRKQLAERDAVPPYAVFTNEQLADMVRERVCTAAELARIEGVGPSRIEKYGEAALAILRSAAPALPPTPAAEKEG